MVSYKLGSLYLVLIPADRSISKPLLPPGKVPAKPYIETVPSGRTHPTLHDWNKFLIVGCADCYMRCPHLSNLAHLPVYDTVIRGILELLTAWVSRILHRIN